MNKRADSSAAADVEAQRRILEEADAAGGSAKFGAYARLSGPGWLQSALTLGGGSLASSLYLGVLGGYALLWIQPAAMIAGIIMLSTIGYVTLSTGERPFQAINRHVSPLLGWSWLIAAGMANVIWCMPQHSLAYAVLSQNLLPGVVGGDGAIAGVATSMFGAGTWLAANFDRLLVSMAFLVLCTYVTWRYDKGGRGLRLYETVLKLVVAMIVLCFVGVVLRLSFSSQPLDWAAVFAGFIPDVRRVFSPAETYQPLLDAIGGAGHVARTFWEERIVAEQRDVLISAAATAVGINMTFLYPYSMMRKGWTKEFRGLARFDLATGMFIPFMIASSCVVIASAAAFHTTMPEGFVETTGVNGEVTLTVDENAPRYGGYQGLLAARDAAIGSEAELTNAERRLAATLVRRDAIDLSASLAPLTGRPIANIIFGLGVLAMVLSTISLLMLVSGMVVAEAFGAPEGGVVHRRGTLLAGIGGACWPLFWTGSSQAYLAVVTSVFGFMLMPVAYVTFALLLNSKKLLGNDMPTGSTRVVANTLVFTAASIATIAAAYMIWLNAGGLGLAGMAALGLLGLAGQFRRRDADA